MSYVVLFYKNAQVPRLLREVAESAFLEALKSM